MKHSVVFAREKRIYADACLRSNFLETVAFNLMSDEHFPLLLRKFLQSIIKFLHKRSSCVSRFWSGITVATGLSIAAAPRLHKALLDRLLTPWTFSYEKGR